MVNGAASGIGLPMATEFNFFIVQKSHLEATNPTLAELFFLGVFRILYPILAQ
jgi:hypothetical protein